jgi:hypothetical protein
MFDDLQAVIIPNVMEKAKDLVHPQLNLVLFHPLAHLKVLLTSPLSNHLNNLPCAKMSQDGKLVELQNLPE